MANISEYISKIRTAIYGKDVRGSLADGLDAVNKETEAATALTQETEQRQTSIEKQFDDQIANMTLADPSSAELVAGRTNVNTGKSYDTIGRRLDAEHADVTAQLADTSTRISLLSKDQIPFSEKLSISVHNKGTNVITDYSPINQTGFKYVRDDLLWEKVEVEKGVYDFSAYDIEVSNILNAGMKPLFVLAYSNPLYSVDDMASKYVDFISEATAHYSGKGIIWEIWNEPNFDLKYDNGAFNREQIADTYAYMVIEGSKRIKANDPMSVIVAPGLWYANDYVTEQTKVFNGLDFLEKMGKRGVFEYIDAVSVHPYTINQQPENLLFKKLTLVKSTINKYTKKDIPIFLTEIGWSTANRSGETVTNGFPVTITEEAQANYLCRTLLLCDMYDIPLINIYNWQDKNNIYDDPVLQNIENNFGIVYNDWTTNKNRVKMAVGMITELAHNLEGCTFAERVRTNEEDYILKYLDQSLTEIYVYWTTADEHMLTVEGGVSLHLKNAPQVIKTNSVYTPSKKMKHDINDIEATLNKYGVGKISQYLCESDANDYTENGIVNVENNDSTTLNLPAGVKRGKLINVGSNYETNEAVQILVDVIWNEVYLRVRDFDGNWGDWELYGKVSVTDWMNVTFINGAKNYNTIPCQYRIWKINGHTELELQLSVQNIPPATTFAVLPAGCRPLYWQSFIVRSTGGTSAALEIGNDGQMQIANQYDWNTTKYAIGFIRIPCY